MNEWKTTQPTNQQLVEVDCEGEIIKVMAFFGRDGYLPHWKSEDGNKVWSAAAFKQWRKIIA